MSFKPTTDIFFPSLKILDGLGAMMSPQTSYLKEAINITLVTILILANAAQYSFLIGHLREFESVSNALSATVLATTEIVSMVTLKYRQKFMYKLINQVRIEIDELERYGDEFEKKLLRKFYKNNQVYRIFLFGFAICELLIFIPYFIWYYIDTFGSEKKYQPVLIFLSLPFEYIKYRNFVNFFICTLCSWHVSFFHSSANYLNIVLMLHMRLKLEILNYRVRNNERFALALYSDIFPQKFREIVANINILQDVRYCTITACVKNHLKILR